MYSIGFIGTASSWLLMKPFGRRDIYFYGQCVLVLVMLIVGILGTVDRSSEKAQWAIGGLLMVFSLTYQFTVGPVCYSLVAEISSTRLRSKTVVLARNVCEWNKKQSRGFTDAPDNIGGIVVGFLNPYMLNSTEVSHQYQCFQAILTDHVQWDLGPKAAYVWFAAGGMGLIWVSIIVSAAIHSPH